MVTKHQTRVCLAVVWHQHQPFYWEFSSNELVMPWTRLHGIKDYVDMAARLERYPTVHQTINLVPSLLRQIEAYISGRVSDRCLTLSRRPAGRLREGEKKSILERFFDGNEHHLISPHARYAELKRLRDGLGVEQAARSFQTRDYLDLQVWFNLAWIDPTLRREPAMARLVEKGSGFTEEDKQEVLNCQMELLGRVIPLHRRLQEEGIIEVSTTPFYHPILPLLCDTSEARVAVPNIALPNVRFRHPEDARLHVAKAVEAYGNWFGRPPRGMWPAEGSVSPEAAGIFAEAGIEWIASDEEVLAASVKNPVRRKSNGDVIDVRLLYRPYSTETEAGPIRFVFRDHLLSDLIGFKYQTSPPAEAAGDLVSRLERIAGNTSAEDGVPPLVSIILDGENCWEYYPNDGDEFLNELYSALSDHSSIRCVTVSEYLDEFGGEAGAVGSIKRLHSGSWINHNFGIWIGHPEDNRAWDLLAEAREVLISATEKQEAPQDQLDKAWEELLIAEGSDWNWWYGDDHHTSFAGTFDALYRKHLQNIYTFAGREVPPHLLIPILRPAAPKTGECPRQTVSPVIDGRSTSYFEWHGSGRYVPSSAGGAMHKGESRFSAIHFGFDMGNIHLRTDFRSMSETILPGESIMILFANKLSSRAVVRRGEEGIETLFEREEEGIWTSTTVPVEAALGVILEVSVPWSAFPEIEVNQEVAFMVQVMQREGEVERVPGQSPLRIARPSADFDDHNWIV